MNFDPHKVDIFSIVPIEAWKDKRLTLEQLRVLGVLFSFRSRNTNTVWPSRQQISERCGMHLSNISTATTALVALGWLVKDGVGGHSKSTRYTITVPDLDEQNSGGSDPENGTIPNAKNGSPFGNGSRMGNGSRLGYTLPVADSARGKEHTYEQTSIKNNSASPKKSALDFGDANPQIVADFLALRKAKKSAVTQTAINGIKREAAKAKLTLEQALEICCIRGWQGFKAEWVKNDKPQQQGSFDPVAFVNQNRGSNGNEQPYFDDFIDCQHERLA